MHLTAYTVLKRQLLDCLGQFLESNGGQFLASAEGLSRPRVFGSVVSGTDTDESDLDLLVDPGQSTSLLTIAGLKIDAEKLLGVPVSVLTPNGLPPKFRNDVLQQAQPL